MMDSTTSKVEKASEILLRLNGKNRPRITELSPRIFANNGPVPGALAEISGEPNSGKTLLLEELMIHCVLPKLYGGKECDIIFLNLSHKFALQRLAGRLRDTVKSSSSATSSELDKILQTCLQSIKMFSSFSPDELELTLEMMDHVLFENTKIALIAVDTLCEFFWLDVFDKRIRMNSYYTQWVTRLKEISHKHQVCCIYTVDSKFTEPKASTSDDIAHRVQLEFLPDGHCLLNKQDIVIDEKGVHFLDMA